MESILPIAYSQAECSQPHTTALASAGSCLASCGPRDPAGRLDHFKPGLAAVVLI